MKKLILIDGNSILFRAYYATAYSGQALMTNSQGIHTNALFAFVRMFEKMVFEDDVHVLVAFDTKEPTKRHDAYKDYKAGRVKMPEELAEQIPLVNTYISLYGVATYAKAGYEADDIIGTMARRASSEGYDVNIYSSDRDLLQLVSPEVKVHLIKKGMQDVRVFTPELLEETYGLKTDQFVDLKAMMGDPSDNIPGIPGVGEKTAVKLLNTYGDLDGVYANKDKIAGKLGEKVRDNEDLARMSRMLSEIDTDAEIDITTDDLKRKPVETDSLVKFFQTYDLHMFVRSMAPTDTSAMTSEVVLVEDERTLSDILKDDMAIHGEFSDYNYHRADLWGIGLSDGKTNYVVPTDVALMSLSFSMWLSDPSVKKRTYDYKALRVWFMKHGIVPAGVTFDLLLAAYLVDSHIGKEEFKRIVATFDAEGVAYDEEIYGKGAKKALPEESVYHKHIASKAQTIHHLTPKLRDILRKQDQLGLLEDLEIPLSEVLSDMEHQGLCVDMDELDRQGLDLTTRIDALEKSILSHAGKDFKIGSTKQLGEVLFEDLGLPSGKKTKTGYSTNADVLNGLKDKHPIIEDILAWRQLTKLRSTYIEGLRANVMEDTKVHTIYAQALTTTGRLSSLDPNLQNIPIRTGEGREIRKIFKPSPGCVFVGADYSQIELRVLAHMANVKGLIQAFNDGEDIHRKTARDVFGSDDVTPDQRRAAKAVNFGIIYGIGAWSLSEDIGVTPQEAQAFIDRYLAIYPEIKTFMDETVQKAKEQGYVETIMRRRRHIPELSSKVFAQRQFGERTAMNAPIQGSAADILKKAMIDLDRNIKKEGLKSKILLQVHDELILEVPEAEVEKAKAHIVSAMERAVSLDVPLETSCDTGRTWFDLK